MDQQQFYKTLFSPVAERIGPIDAKSIVAMIGFGAGGPVNLSTVGAGRETYVTYMTCELTQYPEQHAVDGARFELLMTCDDERWARQVLTAVGAMSMEAELGHHHTIDVGEIVGKESALQGVLLEEFARVSIEGRPYALLRVTGITRKEMKFARRKGADKLIDELTRAGHHPRTSVRRESVNVSSWRWW